MQKQEVVTTVSQKAGLSKKDAESAVNAFLDTVTEALKQGENVQFVGFGTFEARKRAARSGRNPQTGETINIPESVAPAFKPGNKLKEAVKK